MSGFKTCKSIKIRQNRKFWKNCIIDEVLVRKNFILELPRHHVSMERLFVLNKKYNNTYGLNHHGLNVLYQKQLAPTRVR